jgi:hypothetical protein
MNTERLGGRQGDTRTLQADRCADLLCAAVLQCVLDDQMWRNFGFKGRPRRGSFWDRFIDKDRLTVERFLVREFTVVALASTARALCAHPDAGVTGALLARVFDRIVGKPDMRKPLCFTHLQEAIDYLLEGASAYLCTAQGNWGVTFLNRAPSPADTKLSAGLFTGAAMLLLPTHSLFPHVFAAALSLLQASSIEGMVSIPESQKEVLVGAALILMERAAASTDEKESGADDDS